MSGQNNQASGVVLAEQETKPSHVSGEVEVSCVSPAKYPRPASVENDGALASSSAAGELYEPLAVSGETCGVSPEEDVLHPAAVFEDKQAYDSAEDETWEMCLFLRCDPCGHPLKCSDLKDALKPFGLIDEVAVIAPLTPGKVWLLKLKTREAFRVLVKVGRIAVKERYFEVVDPRVREIRINVHWVPFNLPNAAIRKLFQKYGFVMNVTCRMMCEDNIVSATTTRNVRLYLKEGVGVDDIPYLLRFGHLRGKRELVVASCLIPKFKLSWMPDSSMRDQASMNIRTELATVTQPARADVTTSSAPEDFFSFGLQTLPAEIQDELSRYLLVPGDYPPVAKEEL
ncbi:hypothetical protein MTO96_028627 [Rhipicephalus appendiculatus]